ncbi:MAG: CDP-diacylglycerol--glycerol-3-phosphate 3-phosphatidyltransferase [Clostridia bacterium]|nr:CDP-diacylglycerol--glycerol-3-phosphate 3-phosphatidyltransferase [Clostridia bacterium]
MEKNKLNLPNILTLSRICFIPFIMLFILISPSNRIWADIVAAALFLLAALTDLFDGMIARRNSMVTNFGKFLDPIADKLLISASLVALIGSERFSYLRLILVICTAIILLREFSITSIRLIAVKHDGTVIAASKLGKLKTVMSVVCVMSVLLEPVIFAGDGIMGKIRDAHALSIVMIVIMTLLTVLSGLNYIKKYFSYIDPTK